MRGGAIPLLAWGTLLLVLLAINWIWTGDAIQIGTFAYAVLTVYGLALVFYVLNRQAVRRGPPESLTEPEAVPDLSLGSVGIGFSVAAILFGFVWSHFLVFFGGGLLLLSLARVAGEIRSERRSVEARTGRSAAENAPSEGDAA